MAQNRGSADRFKWETRKTALGWLWELYDREEDMLLIGRSPAFYPSLQSCHQNAWFHTVAPLPPIETMQCTTHLRNCNSMKRQYVSILTSSKRGKR